MTDEPKTARELMMVDYETRRLEIRDRQVAMSLGAEMTARFFDPERIEDVADVRQQIQRAAEMAAYEAIQKERGLHKEDMETLRHWMKVRVDEAMLAPRTFVIPKVLATSPS